MKIFNLLIISILISTQPLRAAASELALRIDRYSASFMGKPYLKYPLGEGPRAVFSQKPIYRFDGFDCTTFIETVSALALSRNEQEFKKIIIQIRYHDDVVSFETRNHFIDLEWIPSNQKNGIIKDVTQLLFKQKAKIAVTLTEKDGWYAKLEEDRIYNPKGDVKKLIQELRSLGRYYIPEESYINYVGIHDLINQPELINIIPNGAIISIVRPDWKVKQTIGTNLNVSHQGFTIRKSNGVLYFRHASSERGKVAEEPLLSYLQRAQSDKTIGGINILVLNSVN